MAFLLLHNYTDFIGKLVELYEKKFCPEISVNIEMCIYLSMLFLYGIGKIEMNDKKIKLVVK